ncbi:olfactory receptor 150-like [Chionomys nivalis]|uniref:olfactory receptor 150-like n=1 Tax=Chionomys nivalis TaxID=269649 RepID=UPI002596F1BE|nr:olfactory receptor 150-like [Chionomys nivalis]
MEEVNQTTVTEFILVGLTDNLELQLPLFLIFLGVYLVTVVGNLGMIILIMFSSQLHTPMYYLISSLSFIDCCQSTVITPKMLVNFVTEKNVISYPECMAQFFFFCVFAVAECYMLAVMAYDRYVAISKPLLYNVTMSYQVCLWMIAGVFVMGFLSSTAYAIFMIRLLFCKANIIRHYFCDFFPLLELSCSSTFINEVLLWSLGSFNILLPAMTILSSYIFIIVSILNIQSTGGRLKAFSTCSSHILAVAIFYGSLAFMYLQPPSVNSLGQSKLSSVFYTIVVPMLNPMIYSLRNKDVKVALKKLIQKKRIILLGNGICFPFKGFLPESWKSLETL